MPFGFELGLSIPIFYMVIWEVLRKEPSDNFLILYAGIGLILNSFLGGVGQIMSLERSLILSILSLLMAFLFYLPYRGFFPKKWTLFYYLSIIAIWVDPIEFLQFYFYTALVCSLLSIVQLIKRRQADGVKMKIQHFWRTPKKNEGNSGVHTPYYTASLFAYLAILLQKGF